jgi:RNase P subunit RPR2
VQELDATRWVKTWRNRVSGYILFSLHVVLPIVPYLVVAIGIAVAIWGLPPQVDTFKSWLDIPVVKVLLPILSGGVTYWLTTLFSDWIGLGEDYLFKPAQRVAYILSKHGHDVPYYLFGHDHAHNAQVLETGKWYERNGCMVRLGKRHLHLQKVKQGAWQDHYHIRCPHCGKESRVNYDEDPSMEDLRGSCGCEFSADISADILELPRNSVSQAEYPQIWAYPHDFSGEELHCKHCGTPLPEEQLAQIKIIPPHVVFSRPKYGLEEYQWLDIWSLRCPVCQTELHKRNLRIRDGYAAIRCRKCGHESPGPSPVRRWYLNTGTWMHMFAKERKRLVRREHEYAFVRMIDTQRVVGSNPDTNNRPKVELLRWNDAAGRVEPCETFQGTDED